MLDAFQGRDTLVRDIISKGGFVQGAQHPRIFGRGHISRDTSTLHPHLILAEFVRNIWQHPERKKELFKLRLKKERNVLSSP